MNKIQKLFEEAKAKPSDINEHLDTLSAYARLCDTVVEFGCRWGISTTAFLMASPKKLVSYDIEIYSQMEYLKQIAAEESMTEFLVRCENVLFADVEETDLLFLDSYHVYEQVLYELVFHSHKVRKFLVFHDTESFGDKGQSDGYEGIKRAINGFLTYHPEWVKIDERKNNNGLIVLARSLSPRLFLKSIS